VWHGRDLSERHDAPSFSPGEVDDLLSALAAMRSRRLPLEQLRRTDFPVPRLQEKFRSLAAEVETGRGFVLLRGLPIDGLSDEDCKHLFWGIGLQLGMPLSQSKLQNYIAEVKNIGETMGQATTRAYRAGGPLRFHTDQCDILALMCIREPISGGHSRVVSSAAVHNLILERRPDLLAQLYRPYCFSRQGEEVDGEMPWYERPIFDAEQGFFTSLFSRSYIESAQKMQQVPRLTAEQAEAIEMVSAVCEELSATIELRKGDMQFFNNHVVYHSRTDYQDHDEPAKRRTQLRLWLASPGSRPLPAGAATFFGNTAAGALRGGVTPPSGQRFAFASWQDAGWSPELLQAFGARDVA
jgi:hypothetical protein